MASNQQPPPAPFDMQKLFNPSAAATAAAANPSGIYPSSSYPPPSYPPPQNGPFYQQYPQPHPQLSLQNQRSLSYPTPPLHAITAPTASAPQQNPNPGARLMALLTSPPPTSTPMSSSEPAVMATLSGAMGGSGSGPIRMPSSKVPRGRHLSGDCVVYDVDVRMQGEVQPQLEVTPITKYNSDPQLVFGRQIAVNKTYICYGLNQGNIRVLNINTALRHLLRGHTQRVTDMTFFAEDVHLLASASVDGRIYVWKISESSEEEDKPQIAANAVIAIQILGEGESLHPRVCWHCHKQEILVVGIGKRILRIDTTKICKGEAYSAEDPLKCSVDKLMDGIQLVGKHDGEVTDLSMCQWMTSRLVSSSTDGTIKIWTDRKSQPLAVLRPHEGQPVSSATFLTSPYGPGHIVLLTGGPLNREVKVWVSEGDEGWLLPTDTESWKCVQTLELKSSAEPRAEDAFFNQVVALPQAGLLLLANAKKNAIYAIHIEYGPYPAATRMDYLAEFTVTMPILSFTGISDVLPHGENIVQVYCVQTQAIQQYALSLNQCLPPPQESAMLEKSDSIVSRDGMTAVGLSASGHHESKSAEVPSSASVPKQTIPVSSPENSSLLRYPVGSASEIAPSQEITSSSLEIGTVGSVPTTVSADIACVASPTPPLSPKLSRKLSDLRSPTNSKDSGAAHAEHTGNQKVIDYSVDGKMDTMHPTLSNSPSVDDVSRENEKKIVQDDMSNALNPPVTFKHPTHLITPSEIFMAKPSSETTSIIGGKSEIEGNIQDVVVNSDTCTAELDVKEVGEAPMENEEIKSEGETRNRASDNKERYFCSQASDLSIEMARESSAVSAAESNGEDARQIDEAGLTESMIRPPSSEDVVGSTKDAKLSEAAASMVDQSTVSSGKVKKQKGRSSQASAPSSPLPSALDLDSADSFNETGSNSRVIPADVSSVQLQAMQEMLSQVLAAQKEMQKQMTMVAVPVTKEGKRLEATLGRNIEKAIKANNDALWARFQEENAKHEKLMRERMQQVTNLITNFANKDLPSTLEKILKKEMAATVQTTVRAITPAIEKTVTSAITESFQRGVGDKAVNQLEKSVNLKLEATVARQIQAQFQTSGKQALQETLKSGLEASLVPAFERSCKSMFEQVDAAFQRGMVEHTAAAQQQFDSANSQLAFALRDALSSATSITKTLSGELAEGQRKLLSFVASPSSVNPMMNLPPLVGLHDKVEVAPDPTKELSRMISERKYEEAFTGALQMSDVSIVSWLCSQVDLHGILSMVPLPLSQGVLLSLLQQLACDISNDTSRKLSWMTDVAAAINPSDPMIAMHVRPIFEQVFQILNHQRNLPSISGVDASSIRLLIHVINSMRMSYK